MLNWKQVVGLMGQLGRSGAKAGARKARKSSVSAVPTATELADAFFPWAGPNRRPHGPSRGDMFGVRKERPSITQVARAPAPHSTRVSTYGGSILDSVSRGAFTAATAPFAAIAYPAMYLGSKGLKAGLGIGKMVGRGALGVGKHLISKDANGKVRASTLAKGLAIGVPGIGIPYLIGRRVNQKMRERDPSTMGLSQALHHVHG